MITSVTSVFGDTVVSSLSLTQDVVSLNTAVLFIFKIFIVAGFSENI